MSSSEVPFQNIPDNNLAPCSFYTRYLVVAVRIADAGHMHVGEQEVKCHGEEGQVSHQGEVLSMQNHLVQPVGERQPIQSLAHALHVGVPHSHGQVVIIEALRKRRQLL